MLERLTIRDLALVQGAELEFGRGLTAVTGETGAGQSLTVAARATRDRLAGLEPERAKFAETLAALREAEHELARLRDSLATFAERREYLTAAAAELDEARLREGEEAELQAEAARLAHADR